MGAYEVHNAGTRVLERGPDGRDAMTVPVSSAGRVGGFEALIADQVAFRAWYEWSAPRVYGYLVSRCGSVSLAEELTQQTFVEAIRRPGTFDGRGDSLPWLIGIARHRLAGHFVRLDREERRRLRRVVREVAVHDEEVAWRSHDVREAVMSVLGSLPAMQRAALVFRFFDRLSVREVARQLGRSEGATESLLHRARVNFERAYREGPDAD